MIGETAALVERIEVWPEDWKNAWDKYTQALAHVARLELQLETSLEPAPASTAGGEADAEVDGESWPTDAVDEGEVADTGVMSLPDASSRQLLELEHQLQIAQTAVARAKGASDLNIRATGHANGLKLTEAAVEARIACDPAVIAAQDRVVELKHQYALARLQQEARWTTLREQRAVLMAGSHDAEESEEIVVLRQELERAREEMAQARVEVKYQRAVGVSLRLLVHVLQKTA